MSKTSTQPDRIQILLAVSGILGPILFTIVWVVLGSIQPGYDHLTQTISELGAVGAPNAIIMNAIGIVPAGLLIVAFALGLHRGISGEKRSKIGPALLALVGVGVVALGIFPGDPAELESFTTLMHVWVGILLSLFGLWLAPLVIARRLKEDIRWQSYRRYSLATGAVLLGLLGLTLAVSPGVLEPIGGLLNRLGPGVLFLWVVVMAIHLLRLALRPGFEGAPEG